MNNEKNENDVNNERSDNNCERCSQEQEDSFEHLWECNSNTRIMAQLSKNMAVIFERYANSSLLNLRTDQTMTEQRTSTNTEAWLQKMHWYNPLYTSPTDVNGPNMQRNVSMTDAALEKINRSNRITGLMGVIPQELARTIRKPPRCIHPSNGKTFNMRTERMIREMRHTLALALVKIIREWVIDRNLWIKIFWAPEKTY